MRYFLDFEFIEDGETIDPISMAVVREDGKYLYLLNKTCKVNRASGWVIENVFKYLPVRKETGKEWEWYVPEIQAEDVPWILRPHDLWKYLVEKFIGEDSNPQFCGYYSDYDWVAFCQIFGTMMDLPKNFPKFCVDIRQWRSELGEKVWGEHVPKQTGAEHDALSDARWIRDAYGALLPSRYPLYAVTADGAMEIVSESQGRMVAELEKRNDMLLKALKLSQDKAHRHWTPFSVRGQQKKVKHMAMLRGVIEVAESPCG